MSKGWQRARDAARATQKPRPTARAAMARAMTEDELLLAICEAATLLGWRWTHTRRSDKAIIMGNLGFPDLVLAKAGRVLFLELKSMIGHLTTDQRLWMEELTGTMRGSPEARLIRPTDLDDLIAELKGYAE